MGWRARYRVYIPLGLRSVAADAVVISLHGFGSNAVEQELYSALGSRAASEGFIVVYPDGTGEPQRWNSGQREVSSAHTRSTADR